MFFFNADLLITKKGCYIYNTTTNRISFFKDIIKKEDLGFLNCIPKSNEEETALMYFIDNGFVSNDFSRKYEEKVMDFKKDTFLHYDCELTTRYLSQARDNLYSCTEPIDYIVATNFESLDPAYAKKIINDLKLVSPKIILEINDIQIMKSKDWKWLNKYSEKVFILKKVSNLHEIVHMLKNCHGSVVIMTKYINPQDIINTYFLLNMHDVTTMLCPFNNLYSFGDIISSKIIYSTFKPLTKTALQFNDKEKYRDIHLWPVGLPTNECHVERQQLVVSDFGLSITHPCICDKNKKICNPLCKNCKYGDVCKFKCNISDTDSCYIKNYLEEIL